MTQAVPGYLTVALWHCGTDASEMTHRMDTQAGTGTGTGACHAISDETANAIMMTVCHSVANCGYKIMMPRKANLNIGGGYGSSPTADMNTIVVLYSH